MVEKLRLIWMILSSDYAAVITVKGDERTVAHNMNIEEFEAAIKHLEETKPKND